MSKLYSCYWYKQLSIVLWGTTAMVHNKSIRMNFVISESLVRLMIQFFPKIIIHNHLIKWGDYSEWLSYVAFPEIYSLSDTKYVNCLSHLVNPIDIFIKIQPDATVCRYLFTAKSLYMFRVSQHPSSGVLKTVTAASGTGHNISTATSVQRCPIRPRWTEVAVPVPWPVPEAAVTVFSTPDDGCCDTRNM